MQGPTTPPDERNIFWQFIRWRQNLRNDPHDMKLISREPVIVPANIAQALRLPPGSSAYRIVGIRHADNGAFQHATMYVPMAIGREPLNAE